MKYVIYNIIIRNIHFFDLNERKIKSSISNINGSGYLCTFNMITKDLLIIGGKNKISIINVNQYRIIREIEYLIHFIFLDVIK